jgi:hypothetical protein
MERVKTGPTQPRDGRAQMLNFPAEFIDGVHLGYPSRVLADE